MKTCIFGHRWMGWALTDYTTRRIFTDANGKKTSEVAEKQTVQVRKCSRCGKWQYQRLKI